MNTHSEIIKKIVSQQSAEIINEAIDTLCDNMYRLDKNRENDFNNLPQDEAVQVLVNELESVKIDKTKWLLGLKEAIKKMRLLRMEVAVRLDLKTRGEIFSWIKKNVGEDVMTRFDVNPDLLSGAKIMFEGRYYEKRI